MDEKISSVSKQFYKIVYYIWPRSTSNDLIMDVNISCHSVLTQLVNRLLTLMSYIWDITEIWTLKLAFLASLTPGCQKTSIKQAWLPPGYV